MSRLGIVAALRMPGLTEQQEGPIQKLKADHSAALLAGAGGDGARPPGLGACSLQMASFGRNAVVPCWTSCQTLTCESPGYILFYTLLFPSRGNSHTSIETASFIL